MSEQQNRFIWVAKYNDETELREFKEDKEFGFYDIDKSKLIRFGIFGFGIDLYFEVFGGTWKLGGRMFEFIYRDNETQTDYYLTGQPLMYSDIIQYKNATGDFDPSQDYGIIDSEIVQYNIGYKQPLFINNINFNFKSELHVPVEKPAYLSLRLSSDRNFNDATFIIKKNGEEIFKTNAPLDEFVASELHWEVIM